MLTQSRNLNSDSDCERLRDCANQMFRLFNVLILQVKPGSMGKAAPGYDVRIVNNMASEVLPTGQEGNIAIYCDPNKGQPGLFAGYVDNEKMTQKAFKNNFYFTGDRGFIDDDGYIWFTSRDDDMIISAGYRIGERLRDCSKQLFRLLNMPILQDLLRSNQPC